MNARGGCCIARYSGGDGDGDGGGELNYGISKVERIMLKFRPIAPKPTAAGSGSSCSTMDNSDGYGGTRRRKRKYVRSKGKQTKNDESTTVSKKRKVSTSSSSVSGGGDEVVTLSLMPETPDRKEKSPARSNSQSQNPDLLSPITFNFNFNKQQTVCCGHVQEAAGHVVSVTDHAVAMASPPPQVISIVTVECVTDKWMHGGGPGFTDEPAAAAMKMEMDTCPSFITNSRDVVVWTNTAYKKMAAGGGSDETVVVVVKKFNRVRMPVTLPAFTCKVKVTWGTESRSLTAPCDVWRLQSGGYAWRLDVKAALSLGR